MEYNPRDWYWIVAGDETQVWASAKAKYISTGWTGFNSWLNAGNVPSRIASEDELWEVLLGQYPDGLPESKKPPRLVPKRLIIDRLYAAGLLAAAKAAIDGADLYTQERWNTRTDIFASDPTALAMLAAIGGDPDEIFALPEVT
ncbi:MAG: hypothetical protein EOR12_16795 [Mesorhizobium sp.]|uniref:hypothetical protein n=1 Tax=Mesorhizobium sp. TaxID=1871066 RepID=UPI000FEA4FF4|nr:hypothetical protein [Mesorhizobium sp.]RWP88369.1 MAG: hypothetical protein EOR12_16795 [Mesorhizobium sp.]